MLLFFAGIVIPYWQFVPWLLVHGLNRPLFFQELFANRISSFFAADVFLSAAVVCAFAAFDRRRLGSKWWMPIGALLVFGVSAGLPLLLYLRRRPKPIRSARDSAAP
jgi:hypothetical protein